MLTINVAFESLATIAFAETEPQKLFKKIYYL